MSKARTTLNDVNNEIKQDYQDYIDRNSNIPSPTIIQSGKKGMRNTPNLDRDKTSTKDK